MKEKYSDFASSTGVAIPIIQRDYVQGADVNFEKRNKFITSMFDAILAGKPYEIDFIYGSSDKKDEDIFFQPVDGQQRLTTLALIGWILNQKTSMSYSDKFKPLTYTTRPSTEQFCKEFFAYQLPDGYEVISNHIKSVPGWFSDRWLSDPSVNAMLEFLDKADSLLSIEPYVSKIKDMAECFFNNTPIVFELLDMKALHLNDDLYIKMNARGKLLTSFENWKAEFEGHLKTKFPHNHYEYASIPDDPNKSTLLQYFEYAIEHDWCDLLWPIAYKRWDKLTIEERRKVTYPRIDEFFMNLLDYISRFLYFSSLSNVEEEAEKHKIKEVRMLYDLEKDKSRLAVYEDVGNVIKLFRILDTLVLVKKNFGEFSLFFEKVFISTTSRERLNTVKVNLFDAASVDLVTLCFDNKLQATTEVMLWAVLEWLLHHPHCLNDNIAYDSMTDFLRIIMGWARGRRQRLTNGLNVNTNLRLADYYEANEIITSLAKASDLFKALAATKQTSLSAEHIKGNFYGTIQYDIIRELSTCVELYYSFNLLIPSLRTATDALSYIKRFYKFMSMDDEKRIRELNAYGFNGVSPMHNHYFYGVKDKWDYIFTIGPSDKGYSKTLDAFTAWMDKTPRLLFTPDQMAYYIDSYPDFIKSRNNNQYPGEPCHYFIHESNKEFEVWAVKTYSTQPIRGYNVDPYGFTVEKLYDGTHKLIAESDNSTHGLLCINDNDMIMECLQKGWKISLLDRRHKASKNFLSRFTETTDALGNAIYIDSEKQFKFDGAVMLDTPKKDRIQTALSFLKIIEEKTK